MDSVQIGSFYDLVKGDPAGPFRVKVWPTYEPRNYQADVRTWPEVSAYAMGIAHALGIEELHSLVVMNAKVNPPQSCGAESDTGANQCQKS